MLLPQEEDTLGGLLGQSKAQSALLMELRQIWRYIATGNPAAADQLLLKLDRKTAAWRDFPGIGTLRPDIRPGLRMLVEGNSLLLYEHDAASDTVELVPNRWTRDLGTHF
ncbi:MAG TPA: type II toxin-antitoxin system RelE/ParE family toxin [Hyphomicrobiaceae bacterium]|nr:type II toxin-antitoxin system RelE/ParE family toxin [Hyphomicrobiaceae bacterium]